MMTGLDFGMVGGGWIMLAFLIIPVVAVAWLVVATSRSNHSLSATDRTTLLKERFARGEIDSTEYERARRLLDN